MLTALIVAPGDVFCSFQNNATRYHSLAPATGPAVWAFSQGDITPTMVAFP